MIEAEARERFLVRGIIKVAPLVFMLVFMKEKTLNDAFIILDEA